METEELRQAKERLRQEIQKAAAGLTETYRREASRRIAGHVLQMESYRQARTIMGFMSLPNEPDTREILEDALNSGKTVLLPRCVSTNKSSIVWKEFRQADARFQTKADLPISFVRNSPCAIFSLIMLPWS